MELYQLQTFVVVAAEQSITGAAKRLYTTPSTVSMHIKSLEDELGVQLFVRSRRGMEITPKGAILLEKTRHTLNAAQDLVNHATDLQHMLIGSLTIGLCSDVTTLRVPQLLRDMHQSAPGIELILDKHNSQHLTKLVSESQIDLGFVYAAEAPPILESIFLKQVELVVGVPTSWALDDTRWASLVAHPWVNVGQDCPFHAILTDHLNTEGHEIEQVVQVDDDRQRFELVVGGMGLSLLERNQAEQGQAQGALHIADVEPLCCSLWVVFQTHRRTDPLMRCVVDMIQSIYDVKAT